MYKHDLTDNLVPYEYALIIKQLGYNNHTFGYYNHKGKFIPFKAEHIGKEITRNKNISIFRSIFISKKLGREKICAALTWYDFFKWVEVNFAIFVDRDVVTTPVEILHITYYIKSFFFSPIDVGDFYNEKDANNALFHKIIELISPK